MKSIVVIGGGLIGAASALKLQHAGIRTTLVDPGDKRRGASWGNAGHLGVEQVTPWSAWNNVWRAPRSSFAVGGPLDFRWRDIGLWGPWARRFMAACDPASFARGEAALTALLADAMPAWQRLAALARAPEIVLPHGHATVWMSSAGADAGLAACAGTSWGSASYREMNAADLARYEGVLRRPPRAGVLFNGSGQVSDPQGARDALLMAFIALGGTVVEDSAARVRDDGRVILASGHAIDADAVLIAAGAWSGSLMRGLGAQAPLIGERGYSLTSAEHNWPADLPTTVFEENFVVLTRFTSGLRATSFLEFGAPDAPGDPRKWRRLRQRVADLGVAFSDAPEPWVGPRPTLPDYVPAIGRLERAPRILYAFGHQHLGLTMAAVTAELVTAIATETAPAIELTPFRIERFE
ncbi:MAG: NAD(P)/FAD-dependent oxidoreductase [Vitreimonas sp.]